MLWVSTKEAAEILGKSVRTIQRMVKSNKLPCREVPGRGGNGTVFEVGIEEKQGQNITEINENFNDTLKKSQKITEINENFSDNQRQINDKNVPDQRQNNQRHVVDKAKSKKNKELQNFNDRPTTDQRHVVDKTKAINNNKIASTNDTTKDIAGCTLQTTMQSVVDDVSVNNNSKLTAENQAINVKTTMQITGWSERTIFNKIKSNEILSVKLPKEGGGFKTMVDVRSLPKEAQFKHQDLLAQINPDAGIKSLSDSQKQYAFAMQRAIKLWQQYRIDAKKEKLRAVDADNRFMTDLEDGVILKEEQEILSGISIKTLYRNQKKWITSGCRASVLAPDRKGNRGRKRIRADKFYIYATTWITNQPAAKASELYAQLSELMLKEKPNLKLPSYSTFLNHYNHIKQTAAVSIAKGQGKKTFDEIMPYVPRRNDALPGQVWQYDGYIVKLLVRNPWASDSLIKPVVVYFFDVATGLVTGWAISFSERSDVIAGAWKHAMSRYPAPKRLMPDNPAGLYVPELCAKHIAERETRKKYLKMKQRAIELITNHGRNGMFFDCGVERIQFVTPGNSKGKMIEPAHGYIFRQFETQPRFKDVYVGTDPSNRPEKLNRTNKALIADKSLNIPDWDYMVSEISKHIETYNNRKKKSLQNFSPKEAYEQMVSPSDRLSKKELEYRCLWIAEKTTRNGYIKLFDDIHYQHAAFTVLKKVKIGYDVNDISTVKVYDKDGREFDSPAVMVKYGSYVDDVKSIEAIRANKSYRKQAVNLQKELMISGYDIKQLSGKELIKLLKNPNLTAEDKALAQERMNELEKYPQFNRDSSIPDPKTIKIPKEIEQPKEDISHIIDADFEVEDDKKDDAWLDEIINSDVPEDEEENKKTEQGQLNEIYKNLGIGG